MKKVKKRLIYVAIMASLVFSLSACGTNDTSTGEKTPTQTNQEENNQTEQPQQTEEETDNMTKETFATDEEELKKQAQCEVEQFQLPKEGETVAELVIKDYGSIFIHFFDEAAPKAVENFVTHAKEGYYNGLKFHRVINDFMIQGGDPQGTGTGGESIWGEEFEDEFSKEYYPFRGALCMANAGPNTNGSQFFIVQADEVVAAQYLEQYKAQYGKDLVTKKAKKAYQTVGGTPWLYNAHTVFGQMYAGYDVLDKIAAANVDANDMPVEDIIIEKIVISEYK